VDPQAIRELTDEEIEEEVLRSQEELFRLKFRAAYEELESPSLIRSLRKDVARLKTVQRERQLAAERDSDA
jgi:large subunit ribosomal protein L29